MSNRAPSGHTTKTGPQDYATDAAYCLEQKEMQVILSRIKGLFPEEMGEWVAILPNENRVKTALIDRYNGLHMTTTEQEAWAEHLTEANRHVFESFTDKESSAKVLTMMLEAEAEQDEPRSNRIAYINQRKQEL